MHSTITTKDILRAHEHHMYLMYLMCLQCTKAYKNDGQVHDHIFLESAQSILDALVWPTQLQLCYLSCTHACFALRWKPCSPSACCLPIDAACWHCYHQSQDAMHDSSTFIDKTWGLCYWMLLLSSNAGCVLRQRLPSTHRHTLFFFSWVIVCPGAAKRGGCESQLL